MKDFFKQGKNIAILVLAIVLAGSVACNICLATRRCAPRGPKGNDKQIEQFHGQQGGPQAQAPQGNGNQQGQPPQGQPSQGEAPNAQAPNDGQNGQKKDTDKKGNNDDKKNSDDDDDKDENAKTQ